MRKLLKFLDHAGWVIAFAALCAAWGYQVTRATMHQASSGRDTGTWICPILGKCGPPGTPDIGRW
jgi:hypothetical protein